MKFIYMICLTLSSFFAHFPADANAAPAQYAFFIPSGSFQENVSIKDTAPIRRRTTRASSQTNRQETPQETTKETPQTSQITSETSKSSIAITLPYVREVSVENQPTIAKTARPKIAKQKKQTASAPALIPAPKAPQSQALQAVTPSQTSHPAPELTPEIQQKLQQYQLDDNETLTLAQEETTPSPLSALEKFKQKSISELLATLPYPDFNLPKFKQLYALYGLELRVLNRRGKFSPNIEQEETLAKANSMRNFDVK